MIQLVLFFLLVREFYYFADAFDTVQRNERVRTRLVNAMLGHGFMLLSIFIAFGHAKGWW